MASYLDHISIDQLDDVIRGELEMYKKEVVGVLNKETERAMKNLVSKTKETAPVGHTRAKHYKDFITSKTLRSSENEISKLWYVKAPEYRLSHLLNNGHMLVNGKRWPGIPFITNAYNDVEKDYFDRVKEAIRNG